MKWLKRITVVITMLCIVSCVMPVSAFAVDPEVIEVGETAGALIFDIYGAANNTSLAYDSIQAGPALTEIITLYQEAQAEVGGDPVSMTALGTALLTAGAVAVVYDATNSVYNLVLELDIESFGEFYRDFNVGWDHILSNTAGLIRNSATNLYNWVANDGQVSPIQIYNTSDFFGQPIPISDYNGSNNSLTYDASYKMIEVTNSNDVVQSGSRGVFNRSSGVYYYIYHNTSQHRIYQNVIAIDANQSFSYIQYQNGWNYGTLASTNWNSPSGYNFKIYSFGYISDVTANHIEYYVPIFTSESDAYLAFSNYINNIGIGNISIEPSTYIGDPLQNPLEITIPSPSTPMSDPIRIGTSIEVDPEMLPDSVPVNPVPGVAYPITDPAALNDIIPDAWAQTVEGIEVDPDFNNDPGEDPSDPGGDISEVNLPFLPVTLPSFNFNLSSIWHYVRDWVLSIGSWLSLMFQVWSQLPYAIVVPVYATAVIVIVLGLYKRFFM